MTSLTAERLYQLLPAVHRIRDGQQGEPLRALLALLAQEFEALEENLEQLYDDQFIETCADWVAPYIGDLIGYRPLHTNTREDGSSSAATQASPRAEVAHTIAYRRRKGTAAMLEQLARDVTDWPARATEFFEQLATTQYMNHTRLHALATANLRDTTALVQQGGPFNRLAHTAEMRRPEAGSGRYNIPNVGIFLWRLQPFALSDIPLTPDDPAADPASAAGRRLRFNPLGADQPLFRLPVTETQITHLAEPVNVPAPINLRLMARDVHAAQADPDFRQRLRRQPRPKRQPRVVAPEREPGLAATAAAGHRHLRLRPARRARRVGQRSLTRRGEDRHRPAPRPGAARQRGGRDGCAPAGQLPQRLLAAHRRRRVRTCSRRRQRRHAARGHPQRGAAAPPGCHSRRRPAGHRRQLDLCRNAAVSRGRGHRQRPAGHRGRGDGPQRRPACGLGAGRHPARHRPARPAGAARPGDRGRRPAPERGHRRRAAADRAAALHPLAGPFAGS